MKVQMQQFNDGHLFGLQLHLIQVDFGTQEPDFFLCIFSHENKPNVHSILL